MTEKEQELDTLPSSPRGDSVDQCPSTDRRPARSLSSSATVDRQSSSLLRLVTARRVVQQHHQHVVSNGDCTSNKPSVVPAYGVEATDHDALRQVWNYAHLSKHSSQRNTNTREYTRWFIIIGPLCLNCYSSAIKLYFYVKFYMFVVLILSHATYS